MSSFLFKNVLRGVEKVPGMNLLQVAHFRDKNFLMFPKIGTRSIRDSLLAFESLGDDRLKAWHSMSYVTKKEFLSTYNTYDTIVVLRDPLERLYSCWKQKISVQRDEGFFYFFQYYPLLRPDMDFLSFLKAINMLTTVLYEKHFIPMDYYLGRKSDLKYRFIHLDELDRCLAEILGSNKPVARANVTKSISVPTEAKVFFNENLAKVYAFDSAKLQSLFENPIS